MPMPTKKKYTDMNIYMQGVSAAPKFKFLFPSKAAISTTADLFKIFGPQNLKIDQRIIVSYS
jgi:hypothetical protein